MTAPTSLLCSKGSTPTSFDLYNLRGDIGQQRDLAAKEPERLEAMKVAMKKLHAEGDDWTDAIKGYTR